MTYLKLYMFLVLVFTSATSWAESDINFKQLNYCYELTNYHPSPQVSFQNSRLAGSSMQLKALSATTLKVNALIFHEKTAHGSKVHVLQKDKSRTYRIGSNRLSIDGCKKGASRFVIPISRECNKGNQSHCPKVNLSLGAEHKLMNANYHSRACHPRVTQEKITQSLTPDSQSPDANEIFRKAMLDRLTFLEAHLPGKALKFTKQNIIKALNPNVPRGPCYKVIDMFPELSTMSQRVLCKITQKPSEGCDMSRTSGDKESTNNSPTTH